MLKMDGTGYFQITKMFCYRCKHSNVQCYHKNCAPHCMHLTDACHEDNTLRPQNLNLSSCDESESILLSPSHLHEVLFVLFLLALLGLAHPPSLYFKVPVTSYKGRSSSSHGSSKAVSSHRMSPLNCCCRRITAKAACCFTDVFAGLT